MFFHNPEAFFIFATKAYSGFTPRRFSAQALTKAIEIYSASPPLIRQASSAEPFSLSAALILLMTLGELEESGINRYYGGCAALTHASNPNDYAHLKWNPRWISSPLFFSLQPTGILFSASRMH
ncbi:MAG: hypothetical protein PHV02_05380 [Rhodocyclaceae bacterium]|nr:hypothetical protein [Rhodocyclaceae bacterium]